MYKHYVSTLRTHLAHTNTKSVVAIKVGALLLLFKRQLITAGINNAKNNTSRNTDICNEENILTNSIIIKKKTPESGLVNEIKQHA